MTSIPLSDPTSATSLVRQRLAASALFLLNGALLASWAAEVPRIKASLSLSDLQLGAVLLAFTGGSALVLPIIGRSLARYGIRVVAGLAILLAALALMTSALATSMVTLGLSLLLFGAGFGAVDVALNNAGVLLERDAQRPLMSGLHATIARTSSSPARPPPRLWTWQAIRRTATILELRLDPYVLDACTRPRASA